MAVSVFAAAHRICERGGWRVTNLALQKILYIAQMVYLGEHGGERLVDTDFEAWAYGPVSAPLYHKVRIFGANPIENIFFPESDISDQGRARALDEASTALALRPASELVAITHWERGAWAKHYRPGNKNIIIPDADILDEYRARAAR